MSSGASVFSSLWGKEGFNGLMAKSGMGFIIVGRNRSIVDADVSFASLIGYSVDELRNMNVERIIHPDDHHITDKLFGHNFNSQAYGAIEKRYITKYGKVLWCLTRSALLQTDAEAGQYRLVMLENITVRKRSALFRAQMAAIVDTTADAVFQADLQGAIVFWNRGAEKLYGYTAAEIIGKPMQKLHAITDATEDANVFSRLAGGEVIRIPQAHGKHKDGTLLDVSISMFPLRDGQGVIRAVATVHRDIRQWRQLSDQLRQSQRMDSAGVLAGSIAHDFNNILTVIKGASDVLAQELPTLLTGPHLPLLLRAIDKASSLTRQLLAFSRRQEISPATLDPNPLLSSLLHIMQSTLGEDIQVEIDMQSQWRIREDSTQLEQIVLGLAVNARHAMPNGGKLGIRTKDCIIGAEQLESVAGWHCYQPLPLAPGEYVQITIEDNGRGMQKEVLERIFEPFFTTKAQGEGTGLGLSVVYGVVAQAGGAIQVLSRPGVGTLFQMYYPRLTEPSLQAATERVSVAVGAKRGNILVVDDDDAVRTLIVRILQFAGYEVSEAASGEAALDTLMGQTFDLVVSDVVMSGLSGPQFAKQWHQRQPETPFLFVSGYVNDLSYQSILSAPNFLAKPFQSMALLNKVKMLLA